jgi:hypothetical protein
MKTTHKINIDTRETTRRDIIQAIAEHAKQHNHHAPDRLVVHHKVFEAVAKYDGAEGFPRMLSMEEGAYTTMYGIVFTTSNGPKHEDEIAKDYAADGKSVAILS